MDEEAASVGDWTEGEADIGDEAVFSEAGVRAPLSLGCRCSVADSCPLGVELDPDDDSRRDGLASVDTGI